MIQRGDISALVLSAGYSSRMEEFKPLLPMGPMTVLERVVRLFRESGIEDVRVVIGHRADELAPMLDRWGVRWILNDRFEEGMFSSIQAGVHDLESSTRGFFLLPVDIPLVRPTTLYDLLTASDTHQADILFPRFLGRRGHPPLISAKFQSGILLWQGDGGLRAFFKQHESRAVDVEVADEHVLLDMDTRDEYETLLAALVDYDIPSVSECMVLLVEKFHVDRRIVAHSSRVAQVALELARALNKSGCDLNVKLIEAAALLHDLAKGRPNHARVAAEILVELGYPTVAQVVGSHMDTPVLCTYPISPEEIVCFADRMVQADRIVPVETRFHTRLEASGEDPRLANLVAQRLSNILIIKERLEKVLGFPIERVLPLSSSSGEEAPHEGLSPEAR